MIKNILIVGLGGVGAVYASKISKNKNFNLKILVNNKRLKYYQENPTIINDKEYSFEYITPNQIFNADLIIITTKFYNLNIVLDEIKNFTTINTTILSLINGISSENIIKDKYPNSNIIKSFLMCNSIIRDNRKIIHDGINKIVLEPSYLLENLFKNLDINYEISQDIVSSMWEKYMLNIVANQLSAVTQMTFGEMNNLPYINSLLKKILYEVSEIAEAEGVKNPKKIVFNTIKLFQNMAPYGKTSMLQDIKNKKMTEIEAFAGTIIKLGKKHNIKTPYNNVFYYLLG